MVFKVSEVKTKEFYSLGEIEEYVRKEEESLNYIPLLEFLNDDSIFMDDKCYGRGKKWISFSENGFSEFSKRIFEAI